MAQDEVGHALLRGHPAGEHHLGQVDRDLVEIGIGREQALASPVVVLFRQRQEGVTEAFTADLVGAPEVRGVASVGGEQLPQQPSVVGPLPGKGEDLASHRPGAACRGLAAGGPRARGRRARGRRVGGGTLVAEDRVFDSREVDDARSRVGLRAGEDRARQCDDRGAPDLAHALPLEHPVAERGIVRRLQDAARVLLLQVLGDEPRGGARALGAGIHADHGLEAARHRLTVGTDDPEAEADRAEGRLLVGLKDDDALSHSDRSEALGVRLPRQQDDVFELLLPAVFACPRLEEEGLAGDVLKLEIGEVVVRTIRHRVVEQHAVRYGE